MITLSKLVQAGCQSGFIMGTADALTQTVIENNTTEYDLSRTLRWATCGLTLHGPYFGAGFTVLDRYFGAATSLRTVFLKTAAAQLILFPPYLVLLFGYLGYLEGSDNIPQKIKSHVPKAFMVGCGYWPVANGINFALVPASVRVPYLATAAGLWNGYLSWSNQKK